MIYRLTSFPEGAAQSGKLQGRAAEPRNVSEESCEHIDTFSGEGRSKSTVSPSDDMRSWLHSTSKDAQLNADS